MNNYPVDLHIHTYFSDGNFSPKQIVELALKNKIKAIAITDHDSIKGIEEAKRFSKNKIEIIPGIEITSYSKFMNREVHILGLFIDYKSDILNKLIRKKQNKKNLLKILRSFLNKKLNNLFFHIAIENKKIVDNTFLRIIQFTSLILSSIKNFFRRILGRDKIILYEKGLSIEEAIKIIKQLNGISILAHPGVYREQGIKILSEFIISGGEGIETNYPYDCLPETSKALSDELILQYERIAKKTNMLISGGTDFHGFGRLIKIGSNGITEQEFRKLKEYYKKISKTFPS